MSHPTNPSIVLTRMRADAERLRKWAREQGDKQQRDLASDLVTALAFVTVSFSTNQTSETTAENSPAVTS